MTDKMGLPKRHALDYLLPSVSHLLPTHPHMNLSSVGFEHATSLYQASALDHSTTKPRTRVTCNYIAQILTENSRYSSIADFVIMNA